jgi:hypothetical protein
MRALTSREQHDFQTVTDNSEGLRKLGGYFARRGFPLLAACYRKMAADLMATMVLQRRQITEPDSLLNFHAYDASDDSLMK